MLTPTDVHILIGLLTSVTTSDNVEIMLGDFIYDEKADEKRDVDITVTYKDKNGSVSAIKGIEVKKHSRPLDVTHVEQLCIKLNDMPNITNKAIVSASGYTQPARKKAKSHGVNLYSLIPWNNRMEDFEHVKFPPNFSVKQLTLSWASNPSVKFNLDTQLTYQNNQISINAPVFSFDGKDLGIKDIGQLRKNLCLFVIQQCVNDNEIKSLAPETKKNIKFLFTNLENICIDIKNKKIRLKQALVEGEIIWKTHNLILEFKALIGENEEKPQIGCIIAEMSGVNLVGITVSKVDRNINFIHIPVSQRNLNKIQQLRLR